jgi:hypothetical protein
MHRGPTGGPPTAETTLPNRVSEVTLTAEEIEHRAHAIRWWVGIHPEAQDSLAEIIAQAKRVPGLEADVARFKRGGQG